MKNFNVCYECYDAQDDFGAALKKVSADNKLQANDDDEAEGVYTCEGDTEPRDEDQEEILVEGGPEYRAQLLANKRCVSVLAAAGCRNIEPMRFKGLVWLQRKLYLPQVTIDASLNTTVWRHVVKTEKDQLFRAKFLALIGGTAPHEEKSVGPVRNDAYEVSASYLSKDFLPSNPQWIAVMEDIIKELSLNTGQTKAFKIVCYGITTSV
jgi:hypothetical protein